MAWWKITDLTTQKTFNSDELPLRLIPCIELLNINEGHKPWHTNIIIEVGPARVEMHTGTIWYKEKLLGHVDDADRFLLFQRVTKDSSGEITNIQKYVGLTNWIGQTLVARVMGDAVEVADLEVPIG